jgi:hypothetical protein
MPWTSTALIVLIVAVAIVVLLLIWKGRGGRFARKNGTWEASINDRPSDVSVASGIQIGAKGEAGNVTGVEGDANDPNLRFGNVDVASQAKVEGKVGDITGVKLSGPEKGRPSKSKSGE